MSILRLSVLALLAGLVVASFLAYQLVAPYGTFGNETYVDVPRGSSSTQIALLLTKAGVIRHTWTFRVARMVYHGKPLQAGEYRFTTPASALDVYERVARGDVFFLVLTVPEGKNIFDIGQIAEGLGLFSAARFVAAARDPKLIHDLDPAAPSLEGYLFPSTYHVNRHTTPEGLCTLMTAHFREAWRALKVRDGGAHRIVTLASLVEKEGKLPADRPKIAQVFERRLDLGMKLDCDPTTVYAALLENRYRGVIHRSDLESNHPYNTYRHAGLPPGPIANPGSASLDAVLHPADTNYLFFVARTDGSGGHVFSENMAAHDAAVTRYHQEEKKRAKDGNGGGVRR